MTERSPILLPLLRGSLPSPATAASARSGGTVTDAHAAAFSWGGALRLWPGLPDVPTAGRFRPENYPFSPQEAAACLTDLQRMGEAALSGLPVGAVAAGNPRAARRDSELALIERLSGSAGDTAAALAAEAARKDLLERRQAQKVLLWVWQQEERLADLAVLSARFTRQAGGLTAALGVEPDENMADVTPDVLTEDLVRLDAPIAMDAGLVPPWRLVTANALYFLPLDAPIAVEGDMREDLLDLLDFSPAPDWNDALTRNDGAADGRPLAVSARAPGWKALGRTRPTGRPPLDEERLWITWRAEA